MANRTWGDPANPRQDPTDNDIVAAELENGSGNFVWTFARLRTYLNAFYEALGAVATHDASGAAHGGVQADFATHKGGGGAEHAAVTGGANGFMIAADKTKLDGVATGANNYSHPNHTGDVTSVGDGAQTIATGAVTNAKLAEVATASIKMRTSVGTGSTEDHTIASLPLHPPVAGDAILAQASGGGLVKMDAGALPYVPAVAAADGDLLSYDGTAYTKLGVGADGTRLTARPGAGVGLKLTWEAVAGGDSPLTTKGDLYGRDASADARIPVGANGTVLSADSSEATGVKWETSQFFSPTQAQGDLIQRGAGATDERLAIGTVRQMLESDGSKAAWTSAGVRADQSHTRDAGTGEALAQLTPATTPDTLVPVAGLRYARTGTGTLNINAMTTNGTAVVYVAAGVTVALSGYDIPSGAEDTPGVRRTLVLDRMTDGTNTWAIAVFCEMST